MITRFISRAFATVAIVFGSICAQAHPGHGLLDQGAAHVATSPYHVAVLALIGGGCWLAARFAARRVVPRRFLQCAGTVALIAAGALWTFGH